MHAFLQLAMLQLKLHFAILHRHYFDYFDFSDYLEPDGDGSFSGKHVQSALPPTDYQKDKDEVRRCELGHQLKSCEKREGIIGREYMKSFEVVSNTQNVQ